MALHKTKTLSKTFTFRQLADTFIQSDTVFFKVAYPLFISICVPLKLTPQLTKYRIIPKQKHTHIYTTLDKSTPNNPCGVLTTVCGVETSFQMHHGPEESIHQDL